ncbi:hypothetical protein CsSME_00004000 [Camellia sinensis var. sinensis]
MCPYQRLLLLEQKICQLLHSVITLSKGSLDVSCKTVKRGQRLYKRNLMRYLEQQILLSEWCYLSKNY